jgi:hypothetical protein
MSAEQTTFALEIEEPRFCGLFRLRSRVETLANELQALVAVHRADAWGFDAFEEIVDMAEDVTEAQSWNTSWMRIRADRIFKACKDDSFYPSQRDAGRQMARLISNLAAAVEKLTEAERFEIERSRLAA